MEEVLDVYTQPHTPGMPLICLDETSKQLVAETRAGADERGASGVCRLRI